MRRRRTWRLTAGLGCLLLLCVLAGCAGLEPGRLPTEEERCAMQGGYYSSGVCHTRGGA